MEENRNDTFIDVNMPEIALIKSINTNFSIDKPIRDNLCHKEKI